MSLTRDQVATYIEHTNLKAYATQDDIVTLCDEARRHKFRGVCVNPSYVPLAASELQGSGVLVVTVCGFPLGASTPVQKVYEALNAIANGAKEVDMVANIGLIKTGAYGTAEYEVRVVADAVHRAGGLLKVITENCYLTPAEKAEAWKLSLDAGADFIKTSTGFGTPLDKSTPNGATIDDVILMRTAAGKNAGVKAAGGISDYATAVAMVRAGADRLGTSKGVAIVAGAPQ